MTSAMASGKISFEILTASDNPGVRYDSSKSTLSFSPCQTDLDEVDDTSSSSITSLAATAESEVN
jgi:hypothetical protein